MSPQVDSHFNYSCLNYCSFKLLFIWTTDMTSYPVVQINTFLAILNYFSTAIKFLIFFFIILINLVHDNWLDN